MSKRIALLSAAVFSALAFTATITAPASAEEKTVMVGGAAMFPPRTSSRTPSTRRTTPRWSPP